MIVKLNELKNRVEKMNVMDSDKKGRDNPEYKKARQEETKRQKAKIIEMQQELEKAKKLFAEKESKFKAAVQKQVAFINKFPEAAQELSKQFRYIPTSMDLRNVPKEMIKSYEDREIAEKEMEKAKFAYGISEHHLGAAKDALNYTDVHAFDY